jgi:hypothetical protein
LPGFNYLFFEYASVSWSLKFDEPIELGKGKALHSLRDAASHILALPPRETKQQHWQTAVGCVLLAAEKRGPLMMARVAMVKALGSGKALPSEHLRSAKVEQRPSKAAGRAKA